MPAFKPIPLMNHNRGVMGFNLGHLWDRQALLQSTIAELLRLIAAGTLNPVVDRTFPLEKAAEAHAYLHSHQSFGKVLLTA